MSNELFGGSDLFSYFGGGFVEPTKVDKEETLKSVGNTIDITKRIQSRSKSDKSIDGPGVDTCEGSTQDEINALSDETPISESSADTAELGVKKDSSKNADSKDKKPVFTNTTYICYAGTSKLLTKYFDIEKIGLLSLEDVRKQLEKDFPEMSKQRTFMSFDEKKNIIVPAITGGKKGALPVYFNDSRAYFYSASQLVEHKDKYSICYLAAKNGYYEIRENGIGVFISKCNKEELEGWSNADEFFAQQPRAQELDSCRTGFKSKLPKIPESLVHQLISFFMDYSDNDVEVMGVFYWDTKQGVYLLDVPNQSVSKTSIDQHYTSMPYWIIKVCEIHSHNKMEAYFSSVDNEDELGTHLYGVIGNLKHAKGLIRFDIQTRAGMAGKFISLLPSALLEGDYDNQEDSWNLIKKVQYPAAWHDRVLLDQVEVVNHD
ncbi:hypothetical protein C0Q44_27845 [Paenibacillus sp. PCH8]|uniref:hypothetical protein n=1 Tax=Paenibacillus sp. PCH8 TaxID=2066524 RepID=UPI000CFA79AB|nr:hypothetical protein [Paenibacillus sp. PCH8]PQP80232.1 hypothetical protein C0Q44_27845 [Paenibacillus sp. PCH8]